MEDEKLRAEQKLRSRKYLNARVREAHFCYLRGERKMKKVILPMLAAAVLAAMWIFISNHKNNSFVQEPEIIISKVEEEPEQIDATDENSFAPNNVEEVLKEEETGTLEQLDVPVWTTANGVNLRSEPNTDCEVLMVLGGRLELVLQYEENGWGAVAYKDTAGFVNMDYLTKEEPSANGFIVVVDPGHQEKGDSTPEPNGPDSSTMKARVTGGTRGQTTGVMEYELNLDISLKLRDELEARGYTVYMTRETHDVNISNMERAQYASSVGADVAVRIHANGVDNSSVSGALALAPSLSNPYIANLSEQSQTLGKCVLDAYCEATGMNNQGVISSDTMTGINWSTVPVTILEMGYMTNPADDVNMEDEAYQQKMVHGIANGIDKYFGIDS